MDRKQALDAFNDYTVAYDPENPRIALKVAHTLRVARLCEGIAEDLALRSDDVDLAWLLGLLHDIGRFEQVRIYDTFNDAVSVDHAALGAQVLFGQNGAESDMPLIRRFTNDAAQDELLRVAIESHNAFKLDDSLDNRVRTFCQILRDADKIDILKVNCTCPIEDIYGVADRDMRESDLSPACIDAFYQHRCLKRSERNHPADIMLGHICFAWEIVYEPSLRAIREQGYLSRMLDYQWSKPSTAKSFSKMAVHMRAELRVP